MTFIASVIAKKGVAIIADSLVTSQMTMLPYKSFIDYLNEQPKDAEGKSTIDATEIQKLFIQRPSHTKDYEEKLFRLNKYTGITTTGMAYINGKNISAIVEGFKNSRADLENMTIPLAEKIAQFKEYLNIQIREHLGKYLSMGFCTLVVTHYDSTSESTIVIKLIINEVDSSTLAEADYDYVTENQEQDWAKVVCDGQNKISVNVLYGFGREFYSNFDKIVRTIAGKFGFKDDDVTEEKVIEIMDDPIFNEMFYSDLEIVNLSDLSLQQAVDLASLLMRLEVDFQKYTKTTPTVGGVIKLAVIDKDGFRFILGDNIEPPKLIHL